MHAGLLFVHPQNRPRSAQSAIKLLGPELPEGASGRIASLATFVEPRSTAPSYGKPIGYPTILKGPMTEAPLHVTIATASGVLWLALLIHFGGGLLGLASGAVAV